MEKFEAMDVVSGYQGYQLTITGTVQGVGFRPFIWQLAQDAKLTGSVCNTAAGVVVTLFKLPELRESELHQFVHRVSSELPPLARIEHIDIQSATCVIMPEHFSIAQTQTGPMATDISPDIATCEQCLQELFDPGNRRYHYPFINCTHCGPRLSIIQTMPYDRSNTAMAHFPLCQDCQAEYQDPANRRFHAQPTACAVCGPRLWLADERGQTIETDNVFDRLCALLGDGKIVAFKGIGGFHLACDATLEHAVTRLRERKNRPDKPFALLVSRSDLNNLAQVNHTELSLLTGPSAPIVLLTKQEDNPVAPSVAPMQRAFGLMLPSNPIQHLLMHHYQSPLIMTSGNASGLPPCTDNDQALSELANIADYFLLHDRPIINRLDDSIQRVFTDMYTDRTFTQTLRRARGLVPQTITLPECCHFDNDLLALGGDLKNTFALVKKGKALLSQHLGDLSNLVVLNEYQQQIDNYQQLLATDVQCVAADEHPNYHCRKLLDQFAGTQTLDVQHHHAHAAAVLAEQQYTEQQLPVLALTLDGLGFSSAAQSHALWGGELLKVSYQDCEHLWGLPPVPMPGGNLASIEPWRNLVAHLNQYQPGMLASGCELAGLDDQSKDLCRQMLDKQLNCPLASSAGRLFDAVSALLKLPPRRITFEGQAAMLLEYQAWQVIDNPVTSQQLRSKLAREGFSYPTLWHSLMSLVEAGVKSPGIALHFHQLLATMLAQEVKQKALAHQLTTVVITGGVCQNQLLLSELCRHLNEADLKLLIPEQFPANDGGLALGQAAVATAQLVAMSSKRTEKIL